MNSCKKNSLSVTHHFFWGNSELWRVRGLFLESLHRSPRETRLWMRHSGLNWQSWSLGLKSKIILATWVWQLLTNTLFWLYTISRVWFHLPFTKTLCFSLHHQDFKNTSEMTVLERTTTWMNHGHPKYCVSDPAEILPFLFKSLSCSNLQKNLKENLWSGFNPSRE